MTGRPVPGIPLTACVPVLQQWFSIDPKTAEVLLTLYRAPSSMSSTVLAHKVHCTNHALRTHVSRIREVLTRNGSDRRSSVSYATINPTYQMTAPAKAEVADVFRRAIVEIGCELGA